MMNDKRFRRVVWPLAVAETLIWAALYYSFPALLLAFEQDLGWSKTTLSGAFTVAIVTSALLAPLVGRLIDRGWGTAVFTTSSLMGAVGLILLAQVQQPWQFYAVYLLLGATMAGALYEPCFAILTKTMGDERKRAITIVTLVAGFAGTLSFPGSNGLEAWLGWRGAMWVLSGVVALIAVPLVFYGSRQAETFARNEQANSVEASTKPSGTVRLTATFWLLGLGYSMIALNHGVLLTHLLPLLDEREVASGTAVFAASMIGPMQVAGRLMMLLLERRISSIAIFALCFATMAVASGLLLGAGAVTLLVLGFVLLQGAGYGATSILRPVVTADLLGERNFGLISGMLAVPYYFAAAVAPTLAALIWGMGGYDLVIWFALVAALVGLGLLGTAVFATKRVTS